MAETITIVCKGCKEPEDANRDLKTFWSTAELLRIEPGMYHESCFWGIAREAGKV